MAAGEIDWRDTKYYDGDVKIEAWRDGHMLARGYWRADPEGDATGDTLRVCDTYEDGKGARFYIDYWYDWPVDWWGSDDVADDWVTTEGQPNGYCQEVSYGFLPEDVDQIGLWMCIVDSPYTNCMGYTVTTHN